MKILVQFIENLGPKDTLIWTLPFKEVKSLQNTDFCSNSKPEEKLSLQFIAVNEEFDFFDNAKVTFEKIFCKGLEVYKTIICQNKKRKISV